MTDYIDRKSAIDEIDKVLDRYYAADDDKSAEAGDACRYAIEKTPAADVAPVVRSQWIDTGEKDEDGNVWFVCKECGHKDLHAPLMEVPHCWYCGARMDGGNA